MVTIWVTMIQTNCIKKEEVDVTNAGYSMVGVIYSKQGKINAYLCRRLVTFYLVAMRTKSIDYIIPLGNPVRNAILSLSSAGYLYSSF